MKSNYRQSFILLLFPFFLHAQAIYDGQIRDVATHNPVSFVKVELLHSDVHTFANQYGDFLLKNTETDSIPHNSVQYRFFNNAIIWEGDHDIAMELFSIDGRLLRSIPDLGNAGSYLLPNLPVGIYLLRLRTGDDIQTFKLFSNGIFTRIASREAVWHRSSVAPREDTLMLSKEGYYTRLIPLSGNDTLLRINMLKKENKELHYFNELIAPLAFDLLSSAPPRTYDAYVSTVKIIHNHDDDLMYYINTKRYKYHFTFAEKQLGFKKGNFVFNQTQYLENENRYLYPANLNYYQDLDIYVLYLVSGNQMSCENIKLLYQKILETSYLSKEQLFLFANRPEFQNCEVPLISPEELYEGQNYQALNLAENYGYLRKVERKELEDTYLSRHDIIVFDAIPNDVSVVAGIITTDFQTPLSHINILSHNRGTPNMALRNAWNNPQLDSLLGELVFLKVQSDSFILRKATLAEANAFWALHEPQEIITLDKDTTFQGLVDLAYANHSYTDRIGGKASNFAEILKVHLDGNPIPVPEGAFAIPFYYYEQHLKDAGLYDFINQMLVDSAFINQPELRKARLKELRDRIKDHPLNPELIQLVENKINHFADFSAYRFRSSTNAEDLENFSGAGLYASYSAKKDHPTKTIERAIKKVWASLWNWRAFEERSYYKIVHTSCAMGILVHRSFPDEDANGVVITKNLYNENPGFIVNVQYKEYSIVFPEPGVLHDQLILFTWSNIPGQDFMVEYLSFSNVAELNGKTVLSDIELMELGAYCSTIKKHFYDNVPHHWPGDFKDFGLDIEFKVDSTVSPRKIYIKQARIYN